MPPLTFADIVAKYKPSFATTKQPVAAPIGKVIVPAGKFRNKKQGNCDFPGCPIVCEAGQGFIQKEAVPPFNNEIWKVYCLAHYKQAAQGQATPDAPPPPPPPRYELTAEGEIYAPYDATKLTIYRSFPGRQYAGANFNKEKGCWEVSLKLEDRHRVLELADGLGLKVADELRAVPQSPRVANAKDANLFPFQVQGVAWLSARERSALLGDEMGLGKAQPLDAKILTPSGWVRMGEIQVGHKVINSGGGTSSVIGVFPQGIKQVFRVTFSDGATTESTGEHLWLVNTPLRRWRGVGSRVLPLAEIQKKLRNKAGNFQHFIPLVQPVSFHQGDPLPLHPYILGYLLANGGLTQNTPRVSIPDEEVCGFFKAWLPQGVALVHADGIDYSLINPDDPKFAVNPVTVWLRDLGLMGCYSYEKSIPGSYMVSGVADRLLLLRGLMDGDGSTTKEDDHVEFSSSSEKLARGVVELVQLCGGTARLSVKAEPRYEHAGEIRIGRPSYRVGVAMPGEMCPFLLSRKATGWRPRKKYQPSRAIVDVQPVGEKECQCIAVDAPDKLYVTDDMILTHNTVQTIMSWPEEPQVLCIVPKAVKYNWRNECRAWRPELKCYVGQGGHMFSLPLKGEVIIVNYEMLPNWLKPIKEVIRNGKKIKTAEVTPEIEERLKDIEVVWDEAHMLSNWKSQRSQKAKQLNERVRKKVGLTGTPLLNHQEQLLGILMSLNMLYETFRSVHNFRYNFNAHQEPNHGDAGMHWVYGQPRPEVPGILRRVMLRRTREEVLPDLPQKTYQTLQLDNIPRPLAVKMEHYWQQYQQSEQFQQGELPPFEEMAAIRAEIAESRVEPVLEYVEDAEANEVPLIVASAHRAPIDALHDRTGWLTITGDTGDSTRQDIVDMFQKGWYLQRGSRERVHGVGLTIRAGGVGITLTRAWLMLFADREWTPALNSQCEDRICIAQGQLIHTRRGFLPVETVRTGDEVLTHLGNWKKVTGTADRECRKLITEIEYTRYASHPLVTTHDHPLLVRKQGSESVAWVPAHLVLPGDFLAFPRDKTSVDIQEIEYPLSKRLPTQQQHRSGVLHHNGRRKMLPERIAVTDDFLFMLGWYLAEGWSSVRPGKGRYVGFAAHAEEYHILARIASYLKGLASIECRIYTRERGAGIEMRAYSVDLAMFLIDLMGTGSREKRIPQLIMDLPTTRIRPFLDAYLEGDGYFRNQQQEWTSMSATIASQIAILLAKCGMSPSLRQRKNGAWDGCITKEGKPDGFALQLADDQFVYNPVRVVTTRFAKRGTRVYDLEVDGDESFVVGLAAVHNCRIGQKSQKVQITTMTSNHPLEVHLNRLLIIKQGLIRASVETDVIQKKKARR